MARGPLARLTALALATGTLVAVGSTPASAAAPSVERVFDATTSGAVLRIEVNLPAGVPGVLPANIVQDVVLADAAARTGSAATALGNAFLGSGGSVPLLQGLLDGKAQATMAQRSADYSLLSLPENPLGLTGGALHAASTITDDLAAEGVLASSTSSVASLQLPAAGALDAVLAPLQDALAAALGATGAVSGDRAAGGSPVAPVTTTVEDVLGTVLDTLDEVTSDATAPVSDATRDAVAQLTAEINGLLDDLTTQVRTLGDNDALLDVGLIETTQSISRKAGTATSTVENELAGVSLLGGLVSVDGITSVATASLGEGGASAADAQASLLKADVADLVNLELSTDQLKVLLGGALGDALPADVLGTVNDAIAQVNGLLASTLGLSIIQSTNSEKASADSATASVNAATLVLDPLGNAAAPLLRIGFVPAEATVVAQSISTPVEVSTPVSLPRTGGSAPLGAAGAVLLVGAALVARRRRTATA